KIEPKKSYLIGNLNEEYLDTITVNGVTYNRYNVDVRIQNTGECPLYLEGRLARGNVRPGDMNYDNFTLNTFILSLSPNEPYHYSQTISIGQLWTEQSITIGATAVSYSNDVPRYKDRALGITGIGLATFGIYLLCDYVEDKIKLAKALGCEWQFASVPGQYNITLTKRF
ncbi:MAG: hypothetical protein Q8O27_01125, partial [Enterobacteriaceae bacterium]|nr:hypothetical protein [Enterobacteriaceae bacterium]